MDRDILVKMLEEKKNNFIKIDEIIYEKDKIQRKKIENIISSLNNENYIYIYILIGQKYNCNIYLGVIEKNQNDISTSDYTYDILDKIFKGNFIGSKTKELSKGDIEEDIINIIKNNKKRSMLYGIPNYNVENEEEEIQNIDILINSMMGTEFVYAVLYEPCNEKEIYNYKSKVEKIYENISKMGKKTIQNSSGEGKTTGKSTQKTTGKNKTISESKNKEKAKGDSYSSSRNSNSEGQDYSETTNETISLNETSTINQNETISYEEIKKDNLEKLKLIDETLIKRINYGKNKGFFKATILLYSTNIVFLEKLENTAISLFNGEGDNIQKINSIRLNNEDLKNINENFFQDNDVKTLSSIEIDNKTNQLRTYMTTKELSLLTGFPKKEILGIKVNIGTDYGINIPEIKSSNKIELGELIYRGSIINKTINIDKKELNKHIFIGGVTGSGKTTTCHKLLIKSELPFLVIEPAKTEYRELINILDDIKIYTLGDESTLPFRINPFEFLETENITSHVDMLKASFEASFDMEAAIPQILESAIYKCYEDYGWDIDDNSNIYLEDRRIAWKSGGIYFPILEDLVKAIDKIVEKQGFDERLKRDYIGSIKARLQGLLIGSKGQMLNTRVSINFEKLLNEKVVFELEEIKNGSDKSLIMGLILTRLCETLKAIFLKNENFKHITVIEEAHRILTKLSPGESANKKQAIEIFTDMLAEIRKYGESLIIADQIPNKLATEVLKNTNTKIIHKIFARDDKEAVGDTMSMEENQKKYLSNLEVGEAIVFSQNWKNPIWTKITKITNTTSKIINKKELKKILYKELLTSNIDVFFPERVYIENIDTNILEELKNSYKVFYKDLKEIIKRETCIDKIKDKFNNYEENKKKYLIYTLLINIKPIRIISNPKVLLEKEFLNFKNKFENQKNMDIKNYIEKILL